MSRVQVTRISAYAVVVEHDHLLLCRLSSDMLHAGMWTLPGGGIEFGEDPEAAMIREVEEETGLRVSAAGLAGIDSVTHETPGRSFHGIRIVYFADVVGGADVVDGELRYEEDGTTDMCRWQPIESLADLPVVELVTSVLPMVRSGHRARGD